MDTLDPRFAPTLRKCNGQEIAEARARFNRASVMKTSRSRVVVCLSLATALFSSTALAKDEKVQLSECPEPVRAVIRHYSQQGTLEEIGLDKKKKSGGPAVYEAKFAVRDGRRIEVHIAPDGKVLQMEEKRPKS